MEYGVVTPFPSNSGFKTILSATEGNLLAARKVGLPPPYQYQYHPPRAERGA